MLFVFRVTIAPFLGSFRIKIAVEFLIFVVGHRALRERAMSLGYSERPRAPRLALAIIAACVFTKRCVSSAQRSKRRKGKEY
jgi:hypothetical protein